MNQDTIQIFFALLRSVICGDPLREEERELFSTVTPNDLILLSRRHDVAHLIAFAIEKNKLLSNDHKKTEDEVFKAVFRYEQLNYEYVKLCESLEKAQIPFIPLKGSILRDYYPEPWMRTSCDIDVLVRREDLDKAIAYLVENRHYTEKERATHDVSLFTQQGIHIELHFDLVEEWRVNQANGVLTDVWNSVHQKSEFEYRYEMTDEFFYFYHIAHMAKHFETGGCGIRPFIDLWILDRLDGADKSKREELLSRGGLMKFAETVRKLSRCWLGGEPFDDSSLMVQEYILSGGVYGTIKNRVSVQQKRKGGRIGYLFSRMFIPYSKLKDCYPILEKHPWLSPIMQVRRWFMLLNPSIARMAKNELEASKDIDVNSKNDLLREIGL